MPPLKIAVIQRFLPGRSRGGVGYFTDGLCNALAKRGHHVTVFSHDPAPPGARYKVVVLPRMRSPAGKRFAPVTFPFQLWNQDFSGFDVVHAQGDEQLIRRSEGPPIVRTLHGSALKEAMHNGWQLRSPRRLLTHLYFYSCELAATLRADAVVAVSTDTCRYYPRIDQVIPNGIDVEQFTGPNEKAPNPTILFVGDLDSRKRGRLLIDVVREQLRPRIPDLQLWLVCPDRVEEEGVEWFGHVEPDRLATLYRQAWVFCLPSSYEGFGRAYAEALAAGTPIVTTVNPGAVEVLDNGRYGMMVPDSTLGDALHRLLTEPDLCEQYRTRGLTHARKFAWEQIVTDYERLYEMVLGPRSSVLSLRFSIVGSQPPRPNQLPGSEDRGLTTDREPRTEDRQR